MVFLVFSVLKPNHTIVFADKAKLFDGFNMAKELNRAGAKEFQSRKLALDSIQAQLQAPGLPEADKRALMQQLIQGREAFEDFQQHFGEEELPAIRTRLEGYVADYAKAHNHRLVIGTDGRQAVLFGTEDLDITNELLNYINRRYEGQQP